MPNKFMDNLVSLIQLTCESLGCVWKQKHPERIYTDIGVKQKETSWIHLEIETIIVQM